MKPDLDRLEAAFAVVMEELNLDLTNDNLIDTPRRLAKMYATELFAGLYRDPPDVKSFSSVGENFLYTKVPFKSTCAHHFQGVSGVCHIMVEYKNGENVIGLSKFNRIVEHYAKRPTLQETLTTEVLGHLQGVLTGNIMVTIQARHHCVTDRGVCAAMSNTLTRSASTNDFEFTQTCLNLFQSEPI